MHATYVRIVKVKPEGYIHAEAFAELSETLKLGMEALGLEANVVENQFDPSAANVVLGWHLLDESQSLPPQCILYNLEQLDERNRILRTRLARFAAQAEVWDYSLRNIKILYEAGFPALLRHVPIGSVPALTRIASSAEQDIDVLFYGSMNSRRSHIVEKLRKAGLRVEAVFGVYGTARDALIARSKVVLNVHFYDSNIFEMVRVSYLWMNRKAVVAECGATTEMEEGLEGAASFVPYEQLVSACTELVANPVERRALEERGFQVMAARSEADILHRVLTGRAEIPRPGQNTQQKLSLVVNTWNEENNLTGLLDSCEGVDEMIVADMNSTDRTVDIARAKGATVVELPQQGGTCCEMGRQTALDAATGDWLLIMDADERLSSGGIERIRRIIANSPPDVAAYSLAFHVFIGTTRVFATGWGTVYERHPRLFRKGHVQWPKLVHTVPQIDGKIIPIGEDDVRVLHHNFTSLTHLIEKINRYSSIEAAEMAVAGSVFSLGKGMEEALQELVRRYSPEQDGALSFAMAFSIMAYKLLRHAKGAESAGWPCERIPSRNALLRAVEAFKKEIATETMWARPAGAAPELQASIIIPVHNKLEFTKQCIGKLKETIPSERCEVIIVDNASTDATGEYLADLRGAFRIIRNAENRGFVDACNQGAAVARGRYLVFLNNDTEPQFGWLTALIETADKDLYIGAVGAKLVHPDGRLQEAGGMIFRDGSGWNFGRNADPGESRYNTLYEVDYCSGAALLVRREVFERLGGFDRRYAPAYYEDTDLCFGIRNLGLKVMYCPSSTVVHFEGITAGTDLNRGFKRYQKINQEKFVAKWADALVKQDPPPCLAGRTPVTASRSRLEQPASVEPSETVQILPAAAASAPHILIVDPFLPLFDVASGSLRLMRIVQLFRVLGCHVTYIARNGWNKERYQKRLEALGVDVYAGDPEKMARLGHSIDAPRVDLARILSERPCQLAWLSFYEIAEQYLSEIRRISPDTAIAIDTVDVHFLRERRQAELAGDEASLEKANETKRRELEIYGKADLVVTVTQADTTVLCEAGLHVPTAVIPNVHAAIDVTPGWEERRDLVFVGNFNHTPNIDGVLWFAEEVMPRVEEHLAGVRLAVIGSNPPANVQALSGPNISVLGWVPETGSYLDKSRVSVAPLRVGAGMKGKVGEALSRGLPVVTTSIGAEGMGLQHKKHLFIADDADSFARCIVQVYEDRATWDRLSRAGKQFIESRFGLKVVMHALYALLQKTQEISRTPNRSVTSSDPPVTFKVHVPLPEKRQDKHQRRN